MATRCALALFFGLHIYLLCAIGVRDTCSIFSKTSTVFPSRLAPSWQRAERIASAATGQKFATTNPVRNAAAFYLHAAGIETGYGFFAPNVPGSYRLVFQVQYPDGHTEGDLPRVSSAGAGFRLAGLLDEIADTDSEALRRGLLKVLAFSAWQDHPTAIHVRAILGVAHLPMPIDFERGVGEVDEFLYAYDFTLDDTPHEIQR